MQNSSNNLKWAALFSQTGSEICNLSEELGRYPNLVLSDNTNFNNSVDSRIELNCKKLLWRKYRGLSNEEKIQYYTKNLVDYDIITLHGWLNIVPAEVCEQFNIYNGHPGLINFYSDLKGKDPQIRAWENIKNYNYIGSVIHKVTSGVDEGPIVCFSKRFAVDVDSLDCMYNALRKTSLETWVDFFNNTRYNNIC